MIAVFLGNRVSRAHHDAPLPSNNRYPYSGGLVFHDELAARDDITRYGLETQRGKGVWRVEDDNAGRVADLEIVVLNVQRFAAVGGDHLEAGVNLFQAGHLRDMDGHVGDAEQTACAENIPGVKDAVLPQADIDAILPQFFDAGQTAPLGIGVHAALQGDVDERVGDDIDVGAAQKAHELVGIGIVV